MNRSAHEEDLRDRQALLCRELEELAEWAKRGGAPALRADG